MQEEETSQAPDLVDMKDLGANDGEILQQGPNAEQSGTNSKAQTTDSADRKAEKKNVLQLAKQRMKELLKINAKGGARK